MAGYGQVSMDPSSPRSAKAVYALDVLTGITFRPACAQDFEYCKRLYFAGMQRIIDELNLDRNAQADSFEQQWDLKQVRILVVDGSDTGWIQSITREDELFLAQIFVDGPFQGRGIGTQAMNQLIAEAADAGQAVCLGVAKINPALRLYERLGFRITDEDGRKFYMRRDPEREVPLSS
jgi:GNAT superfamily N-acetyltransferase